MEALRLWSLTVAMTEKNHIGVNNYLKNSGVVVMLTPASKLKYTEAL
jgi:hypothetical protein